ncbi:hypothetical protein SAMN05216553_111285 [Lentzea fradiae]|uniref:Excreted virulence factor EspC, type VII ESX diderm n=1 Tax=Lentzea fradiae TaxID=200378 RepID=A0A1G7X5T4_9PSEU|nr:hypothetical protein [Lentzea fradiae]SDG79544.1 hypothetical protein SAMN05216553_111285 [Lentzea fradiae]
MNGFSVDPAELRALVGPLVRAAEEVTSLARHPDGRTDPTRGDLFAALARFRDVSEQATAELVRDVEGTADRLVDTARHYEEVDTFLA